MADDELHVAARTDPDRAEAVVRAIYGGRGLASPEMIWVASPRAGFMRVAEEFQLRGKELRVRAVERLRNMAKPPCICAWCRGIAVETESGGGRWSMRPATFAWDPTRFLAGAAVDGTDQAPLPPGSRHSTFTAGPPDCGGRWLYEYFAVLCACPVVSLVDENGRFHNEEGAAIEYLDGWSVNAIHGVGLPPAFFDPDGMTAASILDEPNLERRRIMLERFGHNRLVAEGGAVLHHEDKTGQLWHFGGRPGLDPWTFEAKLPGIAAVRVVDATPRPDGTHEIYWLTVPPDMKTARQAVAWTFGLRKKEYRPEVET